jgi:hypothetical protein
MPPLEFPPLFEETAAVWQWPMPPFAWRHVASDDEAAARACRIERSDGSTIECELLGFDAAAGRLALRIDGRERRMAFSAFRRLTLLAPLRAAPPRADAPLERVPAAAQEREHRLTSADGTSFTGRSAGHIEQPEGLYLFAPVEDERAVQRVFVPRAAYAKCVFGLSAEEIAARRWIVEPQALLAALERQRHAPVKPIGQALLDLGLLTPRQLERALDRQTPDVPLGEMLVADGLISRSDLHTALAHKMGYPLVDLNRFPIEPAVARALSLRTALSARAVPLIADGKWLVVAVDRPSRVAKLGALRAFSNLAIAPVLASRTHILQTLTRLAEQDVWSHNVVAIPAFFPTTIN